MPVVRSTQEVDYESIQRAMTSTSTLRDKVALTLLAGPQSAKWAADLVNETMDYVASLGCTPNTAGTFFSWLYRLTNLGKYLKKERDGREIYYSLTQKMTATQVLNLAHNSISEALDIFGTATPRPATITPTKELTMTATALLILIHYYYSATSFNASTQAELDGMRYLCESGLLICIHLPDEYRITDKGRVHIKTVLTMPLPIPTYVSPVSWEQVDAKL